MSCLIKNQTVNVYEGVEILLHAFLMVILNGSSHLRAPRALPVRKKAVDTHWGGGCVGRTAARDAVKKSLLSLPGVEPQSLSHLVCSLVAMSTELFYV